MGYLYRFGIHGIQLRREHICEVDAKSIELGDEACICASFALHRDASNRAIPQKYINVIID